MTPVHRMISTLARLSEVAFGGLFSKESLSVNIWTTVKISRVEKLKMVVEAPPPKKKGHFLVHRKSWLWLTEPTELFFVETDLEISGWRCLWCPMITSYHFLSLLTLDLDHYASAGCGFWQQVSDICWGGHEPHLAAMTAELWEWEWEVLFEF